MDRKMKYKEWLQAALTSVHDGVIATDESGYIQFKNPAAEQLTGWKQEDVLGMRLGKVFKIINEKTRNSEADPIIRAMEDKLIGRSTNHTLLIAKNGKEIPIAYSVSPIKHGKGDISGAVLVFNDQTTERLNRRFTEARLSLIEYADNRSKDEFLTRALDMIGAFVNSPIGFCHFVEPDQKTLSLQQWSSRTLEEFCRAEAKEMHYSIDQAGVWADCVISKKPVIHNDYASLPHKKGMPEGHAQVIRELVVPIMRKGRIMAILGVGNKPTDYTDNDAKIVSLLADVTWEIIQKKRSQELLIENMERLDLAVKSAKLGLWDWNVKTGDAVFGENWAEMLGYKLDEIAPHASSWENLIHPNDKDKAMTVLNRHFEDDDFEYNMQFRLKTKTGDWKWISSRGRVIERDEAKKPIRMIGLHIDISESKHLEEKYRLLVNNLPNIVYKGYPDWTVEFFDNKIEVLTGYGADEFNSKKLKWSDVIVKEDFETVRNSFIKALKTDGSFFREYRIESKTKDVIWIQERGQIGRDKNGNTDFISGVFFDITDRKRSDEEKKKLEIQLRQAQKMEAIGTLTSGIAHDFNNLLTTIIGYGEFALDELRKDTPLYENIEEILHAGQCAAALTRQLLAFSRKQVIQPEILNLNDILKKTQKMLRRIIGEDIDLQANFFSDLWNINADPGQMDQILMNLSVNARDAMPNGGKLIIETSNENLDDTYFHQHMVEVNSGPYVMLAITDTGTGMDKETRDRIFEPFFTTKEMGKGTGLGLSTVYGIVKQNKGHIWVNSEPDMGTTFKVYFPAVTTDIEAIEKEQGVPKAHLKGSETILVVEDDDMLRTMTARIFKAHGYTVISASNGSDGLKISDNYEDPIHLLLTDVIMPGMNGRELAEQIKLKRPEIRIAYMTGYADRSVFDLNDVDTDVPIISKPFSPEDLLGRIRKVLD